MRIQIADRQIHQFAEKFFPHSLNNALAQSRADQSLQQLPAAVKQVYGSHQKQCPDKIPLSASRNDIDRIALQARRINTAQRPENNNDEHTGYHRLFFRKINGYPAQRRPGIFGMLYLGKPLIPVHHPRNIPLGELFFPALCKFSIFLFRHTPPLLPLLPSS